MMQGLCVGIHQGIVDLKLAGCYLGILEEMPVLVAALNRFAALETLNLSHNHLTDTHITQISTAFPGLTKLKELDLEANYLQSCPPNLQALVALEDLNLKNNSLGQAAWSQVIAQCAQLHVSTLRLWRVNLCEDILRELKPIFERGPTRCEFLDVQFPEKTDFNALNLENCKIFTVRNVQNMKLASIFLINVSHLDLSYCGINSEGLELVANWIFNSCNSLKFLSLSGNFSADSSIRCLVSMFKTLDGLSELELASFCASTEAFNQLLQGLASSALESLDISGNLLQADDIQESVHRSLAGALERCRKLRKLNLADNHFGSLRHFGPKLTSLQSLNLERTELRRDSQRETLEYLENCRTLRTLNLGCMELCVPQAAVQERTVVFCLRPEHLFLPNTSPSIDLLSMLISEATALKELDLSGSRLNREVMEGLVKLLPGSVEVLNLAYTEWGDFGCKMLGECEGKLGKLKSLNLGGDGISDEGVRRLIEAWGRLSKLRILNLSGNLIEGHCFENTSPQRNSDLTVLDLRKNPLKLSVSPTALFPCLLELLT
jgi:Leucine-rich repeat (LRR) protein